MQYTFINYCSTLVGGEGRNVDNIRSSVQDAFVSCSTLARKEVRNVENYSAVIKSHKGNVLSNSRSTSTVVN